MNDEQLDDLKQFIVATVLQTEAHLDEKIDLLQKEMNDGFAGVGEAIDGINTRTDAKGIVVEQLNQRVGNLEHKTA